MKVLQKSNWSKYWCKVTIIFLSLSIWSGICDSNPYTIFELKPLNVTESGQSANFEFEIKETGNYHFNLLFMLGDKYRNITCENWNKLVGDPNNYGIITPFSLRMVKDGKVFLDEKINAWGCEGKIHFKYKDEEKISVLVRKIKTLELSLGHYSATITNLDSIIEFKDIMTVVWFTSHDPKM
ncbi:DUF5625 family protein [Xenorhabdus sp. SGI246]|uniref:DUF5625 family protein n=1 Tax=Xenorhabdus sp. SGI246 TaxID=3158263 RepID=UPI00349F2543